MALPPDILQLTLRTVSATQRPDASQQQLDAVGALFDQLKRGHVNELAALSAQLAAEAMPLEVQHFGFQLLQHLVAYRWAELSDAERQQLARGCQALLVGTGNSAATWAVRSKAALLVALVTKRMGQPFWEAMLPELLAYAGQGPVHAEKVCMVLRLVTEEVTWTNDAQTSAEVQQWRREMLASLFATLDTVLPFLHAAVEVSYGRAAEAGAARDAAASKAQAAVVSAALAALAEFAEVAPVAKLAASRVVSACAFLLSTPEFRGEACELLRRIAGRKQGQEPAEAFQTAMAEAGAALMAGGELLLAPAAAAELGPGGSLEDFGQLLCGALAAWGEGHLACLAPERRTRFLQLALQLSGHEHLPLAHRALPLWVALLGAAERAARGGVQAALLPPDCAASLIELTGERLSACAHPPEEAADVPDCFDSFEDWRHFLLEHRELLARIAKLTAALLPEAALQAVERRLQHAVQACSTSGRLSEEQRTTLEAATIFVEAVVGASSQTYLPGGRRRPDLVANVGPDAVNAIVDRQEATFRGLLGLRFACPAAVQLHCRLLEAFVRLLALRKALAAPAIEKVFDMFGDLPMDGSAWHLPPQPPPGWKERFHARSKIPGVLVTFAKHASEAMRGHVEAVALKTDACWRARSISPGERALLCDVMVAAACGAELPFQQQVVEHVLRSTREEWQSPAWRAHLASPAAFVAHVCPVSRTPAGLEVGGGFVRWMAAHHLQLLERAVKRLPASHDVGAPGSEAPGSPAWHALNPHLGWLLPGVLQLMQHFHALATPEGAAALGEAAPALEMGARERALYLRTLVRGRAAGDAEILAEEGATIAGATVPALRSWFRVARESLYQILGHLVRSAGGLWARGECREQLVAALTQHLPSLHHSHARMLARHCLIPLARGCPPAHRRGWLLPVLAAALPAYHSRLADGWAGVLRGSGRAGAVWAPDTREGGAAAEAEVVQERLLRELTAEHLALLRCMQDAATVGEPGQQSVLQLLWQEAPATAMAACMTAVAALWWPDDSAAKASAFLRGVVAVAGRDALQVRAAAEMLRGCVQALANGIAGQSAEVLGLVRDVLVLQPPLAGPREVLLTLPRVGAAALAGLDQALAGTHSEKEQRAAIKHFLCESGSEELQAALSDWRVSGSASVSRPRNRPAQQRPPAPEDPGAAIGLATVQG